MDKPKVLICDDEENIRKSLSLILEKDYLLTFSSNGLEAIEYIKDNPVDLILLDIKMPKLDGLEALKEIKNINSKIKVIIITGYQSTEIAQKALELGASNYIVKPFKNREEILKAIKEALS